MIILRQINNKLIWLLFFLAFSFLSCKENTFKLIVQTAIKNSNPPIVTFILSDYANHDNYEA